MAPHGVSSRCRAFIKARSWHLCCRQPRPGCTRILPPSPKPRVCSDIVSAADMWCCDGACVCAHVWQLKVFWVFGIPFFRSFSHAPVPVQALRPHATAHAARAAIRMVAGAAVQRESARTSCSSGSGPPPWHSPRRGQLQQRCCKGSLCCDGEHATPALYPSAAGGDSQSRRRRCCTSARQKADELCSFT